MVVVVEGGRQWLTMLETEGKQWGKVPQRLDRAGIQGSGPEGEYKPSENPCHWGSPPSGMIPSASDVLRDALEN